MDQSMYTNYNITDTQNLLQNFTIIMIFIYYKYDT